MQNICESLDTSGDFVGQIGIIKWNHEKCDNERRKLSSERDSPIALNGNLFGYHMCEAVIQTRISTPAHDTRRRSYLEFVLLPNNSYAEDSWTFFLLFQFFLILFSLFVGFGWRKKEAGWFWLELSQIFRMPYGSEGAPVGNWAVSGCVTWRANRSSPRRGFYIIAEIWKAWKCALPNSYYIFMFSCWLVGLFFVYCNFYYWKYYLHNNN